MARRLAEGHTVAVVEAESFYELDNSNLTEIPGDASYYLGKSPTIGNPLIDWMQQTTPQPDFGGASVLYPQGRILDEGSTRNFTWYQRVPLVLIKSRPTLSAIKATLSRIFLLT